MVACKGLASGMLSEASIPRSVRSLCIDSFHGALEDITFGKLLAETAKWAKKQLPFPFPDTIGSLFQVMASIPSKREQ